MPSGEKTTKRQLVRWLRCWRAVAKPSASWSHLREVCWPADLADAPRAADFFKGSLVVNGAGVLAAQGVDARVIEESGPANAEVAEAMAEAARRHFDADVGIGVTGLVTDPTPASGPIGTSHIGFSLDGRTTSTSGLYPTQRLRIRGRAVTHTLLELIQLLRRH